MGKQIRLIPYLFVILALMQSCAFLGSPRVQAPCDGDFEALFPVIQAADGLEIVGKARLEVGQYRIRGLLRVVYSTQENAARLDFRSSSLFGTIEEDVTVLVGDSIIIFDRESGTYFGNDSARALVEDKMGEKITAQDVLLALLFSFPRCAELRSPAIEYSGAGWRLKAEWRGRRIEMRGERGAGVSELGFRFEGEKSRYGITYGRPVASATVRYPAWIKLSKDAGGAKALFEVNEIKEVTPPASLFEAGGSMGR
ncbi:MAG: hypothetical protein PHD74_00400 [Candidatus Krumholzibacteria bacterium]|nr:hypothetical protein [Candidatus Krumholzibacteria bacterium]